jgi:hypothetical protein
MHPGDSAAAERNMSIPVLIIFLLVGALFGGVITDHL